MDQDAAEFIRLLCAAAGGIRPLYFQLPVAGREDPQYRERVYTYELYHQLRIRWSGRLEAYSLGGEVDKTGHPLIRGNDLDRAKPDFIVHVPGYMELNLAVVEVKAALPSARDVTRDLAKLVAFCDPQRGHYTLGVYLVYGTRPGDVPELLTRCRAALDALDTPTDQLQLLLHSRPSQEPVRQPWH